MKAPRNGKFCCDICKNAFYNEERSPPIYRWINERDYVIHRKKIHDLETIGWITEEIRAEKEVYRY